MTSKKISRFSGEGNELSVERIKDQGRTGEVNLKDFGAENPEKAGTSSLEGRWDGSDPCFVFESCPLV